MLPSNVRPIIGILGRASLNLLFGTWAILPSVIPVMAQDYVSPVEPTRVALVIGNENYKRLEPLPSARRDGEMMVERLRELGFSVQYHADVETLEQFEDEVLPKFRAKLTKGAFVVFFFSGHGFSYGADNFLAPTKLPLSIEKSKVASYAIAVDAFRDLIATYRPGLVMFFLDACRSGSTLP